MSELILADGLSLPAEEAASQVYAALGRRGSGKTFAAGKLVEELIDFGHQVVIVDPVGTWYGLRLAADGKSAGLPIPVLGGQHGDLPLEPTAGTMLADFVAETRASLVFDVSEFTGADQRRFVARFAERLLDAKKRHKSSLLVVWEEAQEFAPQGTGAGTKGEVAAMLGAVTRLVKLGRNFGVGHALITQRPQAVTKEVLNQAELLMAFQMTGPHERKAVEEWVQEKGADRAVVGELPGLPVGTALVWSPSWLRTFGRFKVHPKRTYDASSTPGSAPIAAANLTSIDLDALSQKMAATIEKAKADDPRDLRKKIAELEREAAKKPEPEVRVERVEVSVLRDEDRELLLELWQQFEDLSANLKASQEMLSRIRGSVGTIAERPVVVAKQPSTATKAASTATRVPSTDTNGPSTVGDVKLGKAERTILGVLATSPKGRSQKELSILTGYSAKASTIGVALSVLRRAGLVEPTGTPMLTAAGVEASADVEPLPTGEALIEYWRGHQTVGKAERAVFDALVNAYPNELSHGELCEVTGYRPTASTVGVALSVLRRIGIVTGWKASDELMEGVR